MTQPGSKEVTHGGGASVGLADALVDYIMKTSGLGGVNGGTPMGQTAGADPIGKTNLVTGNIEALLGGTDVAGSISSILERQQSKDVADLRERYTASGAGSSVGSPAAAAEADYRAAAAPQAGLAISQARLNALNPILNIIAQLAGKGTTQAQSELLVSPSPLSQGASLLAGGAAGFADVMGGLNAGKLRR